MLNQVTSSRVNPDSVSAARVVKVSKGKAKPIWHAIQIRHVRSYLQAVDSVGEFARGHRRGPGHSGGSGGNRNSRSSGRDGDDTATTTAGAVGGDGIGIGGIAVVFVYSIVLSFGDNYTTNRSSSNGSSCRSSSSIYPHIPILDP